MLENPEILRKLVAETGAKSTDLQSPESAEHLCAKCDRYAENWKPVAEEMWKEDQERKAAKKGCWSWNLKKQNLWKSTVPETGAGALFLKTEGSDHEKNDW